MAKAKASCAKWRGTPHKNRIAEVGVGVDCIKFVHEVIVDSGIIPRQEFGGYSIHEGTFGMSDVLKNTLEAALNVERVEIENHAFGDIAVFKNGMMAGHCGFVTETHLWHALANKIVTPSQFNLWAHEIDFLFRVTEMGMKIGAQEAIEKNK